MKRILMILAALLFAACGAAPESDATQEPQFLIDSDGSEMADAPYQPDQTYAPEDGVARQEWVSALYYGDGHNSSACGAANSGDCDFPQFKNVHITMDYASCDALPQTSQQTNRSYLDEMLFGVQTWNGVAGMNISLGSCSGSNECVFLHCEPDGGFFGEAEKAGGHIIQVQDLPRAGARAILWSAFHLYVNPAKVFSTCGNHDTAVHIGEHEMGHALGFGHFSKTGDFMNAQAGCSSAIRNTIAPAYATAIAGFQSSGGAILIVADEPALTAQGPCDGSTHTSGNCKNND